MIQILIDSSKINAILLLKIDLSPQYSIIIDRYYLFDFLEISQTDIEHFNSNELEILQYLKVRLIDYFIVRIKSISEGEHKFVPFDLSDEYIGGFLIEKTQLHFKVKLVWTRNLNGYLVSKLTLDKNTIENQIIFENDNPVKEWVISEKDIFEQLNQNQ